MAQLLFVDESGQDRGPSPYEVLAGVSVEDRSLWPLVCAIQKAEHEHFGRRYSEDRSELKGKKLLKAKTFRQAVQLPRFVPDERQALARRCLDDGAHAGKREITALAQAKLSYVKEVFLLCRRFGCHVFASVIDRAAPRPASRDVLRKDYAYLFERFFYFLNAHRPSPSGLVVFDELERSQSHVLVQQMDRYFKETAKGAYRARLIVPEPLFVHSDLTTGIQLADLVAYVLSWGFRTSRISAPHRAELEPLADQVAALRHRVTQRRGSNPNFHIWSVAHITDLRARDLPGP